MVSDGEGIKGGGGGGGGVFFIEEKKVLPREWFCTNRGIYKGRVKVLVLEER